MKMVEIRDKGWNRLVKDIKGVSRVYVGVLGDKASKKYPDAHGKTTAEVAAIHEFGDPAHNIPQRSVIRSTIRKNDKKYSKLLAKAVKQIVFGHAPDLVLLKVGLIAAGDMKRAMAMGIPPPLSDKTIAARKRRFGKESTKPLIATGQYRGSLDAEVRKR